MAGKILVFAFLLGLGSASAQFPYCSVGLSGQIPDKYEIVKLPDLTLWSGAPSWTLKYQIPPNCYGAVLQVTVCDVSPPKITVLSNTQMLIERTGDLSSDIVAQALYYCPRPANYVQKEPSKYDKQPVAVPLDKVRK